MEVGLIIRMKVDSITIAGSPGDEGELVVYVSGAGSMGDMNQSSFSSSTVKAESSVSRTPSNRDVLAHSVSPVLVPLVHSVVVSSQPPNDFLCIVACEIQLFAAST